MKKFFDLRFVIGLFFLILGILLIGYSFLFHKHAINEWSGAFFTLFGIVMIAISSAKFDE